MTLFVSRPMTGPLAPFTEGFIAQLTNRGYSVPGISSHRGLLAHLDRWLAESGCGVRELTPQLARKFLRARRDAGYVTKLSDRGLNPLLSYLGELGELPEPIVVANPVEELVALFRHYQLEQRGLGSESVSNYERVVRLFLATRPEPMRAGLAGLCAADVVAFVLDQCGKHGVASAKNMVDGLRALLKYLHVEGWIPWDLTAAVPKVARRREDLPRALADGQVAKLLRSCDRATSVGIRDFAILTTLVRLGVRGGEVASLELRDIDWRAGELLIHGKGPRVDGLPLPCDVGEALADYLRRSRPHCSHPRLFIRSCAPLTGLSRQGVGGIVRAASLRAGLPPLGPHRLRHTVATGLLRHGASLPEIAQLLRHKNIQTTTIYAKVDQASLATLALAWPGAAA